jgi:hypothetical protein
METSVVIPISLFSSGSRYTEITKAANPINAATINNTPIFIASSEDKEANIPITVNVLIPATLLPSSSLLVSQPRSRPIRAARSTPKRMSV